jgi:hypothetical protein
MTRESSSVGRCCRNSAAMLAICDSDRSDLQKHNRGQAELLLRAADIADEMFDLAKNIAGIDDRYLAHTSILASAAHEWRDQARAVIAKAEGRDA